MNWNICKKHRNRFSHIIIQQEGLKLLCGDCFLKLQEDGEEINIEKSFNLFQVFSCYQKIIDCPAYLLSKTKHSKVFPGFFEELVKFDENEFKQAALNLEEKFNLMKDDQKVLRINTLKRYIQFIISDKQEILLELQDVTLTLSQIVKLDQLTKLIQELEMNEQINPDIINLIQLQFAKDYNAIQQDQENRIKEQIRQIIETHFRQLKSCPKFENSNMQNLELYSEQQQFYNSTLPKYQEYLFEILSKSELLSYFFARKLKKQIERGINQKIKSTNLIYNGQRDGLDAQSFWEKVQGKSELLMVFMSNNCKFNVYGSYSPCQWDKYLMDYVEDDSVTSFLFSQTHNEIYMLKKKKKQFALYCDFNSGPIFGLGPDICIEGDFNDGGSKLGASYYFEDYKPSKNSHYLFGGQFPKIVQCEIFQIEFR